MSTYLIDCSKKCLIGNTYSLMGDITESSLQSLGLCFKENFMTANDQLKKDFDKLTKPIKTMVQGVLSAIPILKGIDIQNGDIRETLINGYVLLTAFMGGDPVKQLDQWNQIYLKNYPLRKGPPVIGLKSGGITIEFAYGKANMFDAYYEVFQPLSSLQRSIFPSFTEKGSLVRGGIHYVQESFPAIVKGFVDSSGITTYINQSKSLNSITKSIKQTFNSKKLKVSAKASLKKEASGVTYENWGTSKVTLAGLVELKNGENSEKATFSSIADLIKNANADELFKKDTITIKTEDSSEEEEDEKPKPKTKLNVSKFMELIEEDLDTAIDSMYEEGSELTYSSGFSKKTEEAGKDTKSLSSDFKSIMDSVVTLEHKTLENAMTYLRTFGRGIHLGFPSIYYTSQQNVNEFCGKEVNARIHYNNVIIQGANITFDYSKVDEAGYPMAGKLVIEQLWNVNTPQNTLSFTTGDGSRYGKETLTLVDSDIATDNAGDLAKSKATTTTKATSPSKKG